VQLPLVWWGPQFTWRLWLSRQATGRQSGLWVLCSIQCAAHRSTISHPLTSHPAWPYWVSCSCDEDVSWLYATRESVEQHHVGCRVMTDPRWLAPGAGRFARVPNVPPFCATQREKCVLPCLVFVWIDCWVRRIAAYVGHTRCSWSSQSAHTYRGRQPPRAPLAWSAVSDEPSCCPCTPSPHSRRGHPIWCRLSTFPTTPSRRRYAETASSAGGCYQRRRPPPPLISPTGIEVWDCGRRYPQRHVCPQAWLVQALRRPSASHRPRWAGTGRCSMCTWWCVDQSVIVCTRVRWVLKAGNFFTLVAAACA